MTRQLRGEKVAAQWLTPIPEQRGRRARAADLLVLGWGSTSRRDHQRGSTCARSKGYEVSRVHLRYLNPLPRNLEGELLERFDKVLGARR